MVTSRVVRRVLTSPSYLSRAIRPGTVLALSVLSSALLLSLFTVSQHVKARGFGYLEGRQLQRHEEVLAGAAQAPWQYRVLAPHLVEGVRRALRQAGVANGAAEAFILSRVIVDAAIFALSFLYYRRLGLTTLNAFLGMSILAWGISYAHYDSDLQANTYLDVLCYLFAGWCVLAGRQTWIVPLVALAALNRETSGLIPFLASAAYLAAHRLAPPTRTLAMTIAAVAVYFLVFIALRAVYGWRPVIIPYGHAPGLDLLQYNVGRIATWYQLFITLGLIPVLALIGYRTWPPALQGFFWLIVPIWGLVHLFASVMAETRLFLVPHAMIFVPGALLAAQSLSDTGAARAKPDEC